MVINNESDTVLSAMEMAFAHTVPFALAVISPVPAIVAPPVTGTMVQVTLWLAVAGKIVETICKVPALVVMVAGTFPCVLTSNPNKPPGVIFWA